MDKTGLYFPDPPPSTQGQGRGAPQDQILGEGGARIRKALDEVSALHGAKRIAQRL
jgi:hypothetical protein